MLQKLTPMSAAKGASRTCLKLLPLMAANPTIITARCDTVETLRQWLGWLLGNRACSSALLHFLLLLLLLLLLLRRLCLLRLGLLGGSYDGRLSIIRHRSRRGFRARLEKLSWLLLLLCLGDLACFCFAMLTGPDGEGVGTFDAEASAITLSMTKLRNRDSASHPAWPSC